MDRRIETRVVEATDGATATLIQKDACEVYWIDLAPEAPNAPGALRLYDGFDTDGKLKFLAEIAYSRMCNFIPPIPCDQGIYVTTEAAIASYTIAYRPKKWTKE